ncbi:hypothetical protein HELRODRAFT_83167, partial [Helobdella robusta]|uniref:FACT complex subunit SSRP1 n=1 Tax=Helobdella robusta TaxID=6412 RepID=T1G514_HELRO
QNSGKLKFQSNNITFKNVKTGKIDQYQINDLEQAFWLTRARCNCLKIVLKPGLTYKFDGFRESDFEKVSEFIKKNYDLKLEKKDSALKGWNWGNAKFNGNTLDFQIENATAFEIPLTNISHSLASKNEVTIEFHQNDDAPVSLMELRFHIPSDSAADVDPITEFHNSIMSKADVVQATGDAITIFNVHCLTPRGNYEIKIFPSFLQLHGKTFDYKIPYTTILRLFLLPHRDGRQFYFMANPPIKQGQTRYHFLILLFNREVETTLELSLTQQDINEKYDGKLQKEMSGPEHEVISRIMKVLVNKKITVPGSFLGHTRTHSISCSYKAATGSLYPLERGFVFVHKPPIHVRFDEISVVNFGRSAGSTRYFDFDVETTSGPVYNFVGIEKDEYGQLFDFVKQKNLRVKNVDKTDEKSVPVYGDDMEESDDDDRVHNAYMEKMKSQRQDKDADEDDDESGIKHFPFLPIIIY